MSTTYLTADECAALWQSIDVNADVIEDVELGHCDLTDRLLLVHSVLVRDEHGRGRWVHEAWDDGDERGRLVRLTDAERNELDQIADEYVGNW